MLESLVNELKTEIGIESNQLINKQYALPFANDILVNASELSDTITLKATICPCPRRKEEQFIRKLMEANLFGIGTQGASIGFLEKGNLLTLSLELDYNCSYEDFKSKLTDFISVIEFWRNESLKQQ